MSFGFSLGRHHLRPCDAAVLRIGPTRDPLSAGGMPPRRRPARDAVDRGPAGWVHTTVISRSPAWRRDVGNFAADPTAVARDRSVNDPVASSADRSCADSCRLWPRARPTKFSAWCRFSHEHAGFDIDRQRRVRSLFQSFSRWCAASRLHVLMICRADLLPIALLRARIAWRVHANPGTRFYSW